VGYFGVLKHVGSSDLRRTPSIVILLNLVGGWGGGGLHTWVGMYNEVLLGKQLGKCCFRIERPTGRY
jgi:hypothetical protein